MAVTEEAIANILDNSIELSAQYNIDARGAFVKEVSTEEIEEPLTLDHLPSMVYFSITPYDIVYYRLTQYDTV